MASWWEGHKNGEDFWHIEQEKDSILLRVALAMAWQWKWKWHRAGFHVGQYTLGVESYIITGIGRGCVLTTCAYRQTCSIIGGTSMDINKYYYSASVRKKWAQGMFEQPVPLFPRSQQSAPVAWQSKSTLLMCIFLFTKRIQIVACYVPTSMLPLFFIHLQYFSSLFSPLRSRHLRIPLNTLLLPSISRSSLLLSSLCFSVLCACHS
jgi:hypothetical protein